MPAIISIVGKSESGKTTLIEKLIPELSRRGYRIGAIKHAAHAFEFDRPGKDSWRIKAAGAETVLVASPDVLVMVKNCREQTIDELADYFKDLDLILTEGYKRGDKPKIEIFRKERHRQPLSTGNSDLIAFVTNSDIKRDVPMFGMEDIGALADLIEEKFLKHRGPQLD